MTLCLQMKYSEMEMAVMFHFYEKSSDVSSLGTHWLIVSMLRATYKG